MTLFSDTTSPTVVQSEISHCLIDQPWVVLQMFIVREFDSVYCCWCGKWSSCKNQSWSFYCAKKCPCRKKILNVCIVQSWWMDELVPCSSGTDHVDCSSVISVNAGLKESCWLSSVEGNKKSKWLPKLELDPPGSFCGGRVPGGLCSELCCVSFVFMTLLGVPLWFLPLLHVFIGFPHLAFLRMGGCASNYFLLH